jgi:hypothetical protein
MYSLTQLKQATPLFLIILVGLAVLPLQAVVPPPDGGYPNFTTAEGTKALQNLTTGAANTGVGWYALFSVGTGSNNTAVGAGALDLNTADNNTAVGIAALLLNTTGTNNTANGAATLVFNDTGEGNTATGAFALYANTEGQFNTANGEFALGSNTIGERNTAIGDSALYFNTEGSRNTAVGNPALLNNTTGNGNTAIGAGALFSNHANFNTAVGADALSDNIDGLGNVAVGASALENNTTGDSNTALGSGALFSNIQNGANTAVGYQALEFTTSGSNTAVGYQALVFNDVNGANTAVGWQALHASTGQGNTALGHEAGSGVNTANNVICIGAHGADVDDSCYVGNIFGQPGGSQAVYVSSAGKLGAQVSSRRFKDDIKPMEQASEVIYRLKPVSFRYKPEIEPARPLAFGLIAEEVEQVNPDLVARDKEGKPYSVHYDQVNAMLLNEFLKEHCKNEEQEATIAQLKQNFQSKLSQQQKQIEALAAGLQKVSAQLELSKPAPQTVLNGR